MNLKDCLNYHRYCIVCNSNMRLSSPELIGVTLVEHEEGIHIRTGHKEVGVELFNNGTYTKSRRWSNSYSNPLIIKKACPFCNNSVRVKGRTAGMTTGFTSRIDKYATCHIYTFSLTTLSDPLFGKDGTFTCSLNQETIKFENDNVTYRIFTDFDNKSEFFKETPPEPGLRPGQLLSTFDFPQPKTMYMNLPPVKTDKIFSKEQMIDKINTYVLFS